MTSIARANSLCLLRPRSLEVIVQGEQNVQSPPIVNSPYNLPQVLHRSHWFSQKSYRRSGPNELSLFGIPQQ